MDLCFMFMFMFMFYVLCKPTPTPGSRPWLGWNAIDPTAWDWYNSADSVESLWAKKASAQNHAVNAISE